MAHWLKRLWSRAPTIGDLIAANIAEHPEQWSVTWTSPRTWEYRNETKGWVLHLYSWVSDLSLSFDKCSLTRREQRRILKPLMRMNKAKRLREREAAMRRELIRAVN